MGAKWEMPSWGEIQEVLRAESARLIAGELRNEPVYKSLAVALLERLAEPAIRSLESQRDDLQVKYDLSRSEFGLVSRSLQAAAERRDALEAENAELRKKVEALEAAGDALRFSGLGFPSHAKDRWDEARKPAPAREGEETR